MTFKVRENIAELIEVPLMSKSEALMPMTYQAAFRSLLGALSWITVRVRLDMAYSVSVLSRCAGKATWTQMGELNKVARKLKAHCWSIQKKVGKKKLRTAAPYNFVKSRKRFFKNRCWWLW